MISVSLATNLLVDRTTDAYVFFTRHGFDFARLQDTAKKIYPHFEAAVKERGFTGKAGSSLILNAIYNDKAVYLIQR